jgi:hypothetical protein
MQIEVTKQRWYNLLTSLCFSFSLSLSSFLLCLVVMLLVSRSQLAHFISFVHDVHCSGVLRFAGAPYHCYFLRQHHFRSWNLPGWAKCTRSVTLGWTAGADLLVVSASICSGIAGCDVVTPTLSPGISRQQGQSIVARCGWSTLCLGKTRSLLSSTWEKTPEHH